MGRSKGDGSIFQRADGRWVGTIDVGWVDGKRKRRSVVGKKRSEVVIRLARLQKQVDAGVLPTTASVDQWMQHWLNDICTVRLRESTVYRYRGYVRRWITPTIGKVGLQRLQPEQVRGVYDKMRRAGQSDGSIRQVHAILRRALVVAEREGRILRNPAAVVEVSAKRGTPHRSPSAVEAVKIIEAADTPRTRARLVCALVLGLRQGEALGLRWGDVDLANGRMRIRESLSVVPGKGASLGDPKTSASRRTIPLPSAVVDALRDWASVADSEWVFPGRDGGMVTDPRADWAVWRAALDRAGVDHMPLHGARGGAASLLAAMGIPERWIADILGHATPRITQEHYIHSDEEQRLGALDRLATSLQLGTAAIVEQDAQS